MYTRNVKNKHLLSRGRKSGFNGAVYRADGENEYLVNTKTGFLVCISPFMRVDTFEYRNEKFKSKNSPLRWMTISRAKLTVKLPCKGVLSSDHIFFYAENLSYDKGSRNFTCNGLHYFDGLGNLNIRIKNAKTNAVRNFEKQNYEQMDNGGRITWICKEDSTLTFTLTYKHRA